jgi:hypothetical protein
MRVAASEADRFFAMMFATQLGLISTQQVERAGFDRRTLYRRCDQGLLVPVFRNVFRAAHVLADTRQLHLAAGLAVPGSAISGLSAAILHGFPIPSRLNRCPDTFVMASTNRQCTIDGIEIVRTRHLLPAKQMFGAFVLTPAATVVSLASDLTSDDLERALDQGLLQRWYTVNTIREIIESRPPTATHGRTLLTGLLDSRSDGSWHRSKTEQRCGRWLTAGGLTNWRRNFAVRIDGENEPVEVDYGWPTVRLSLEVSPFATHATKRQQERDAERRTLLTRMKWRVVEATDRHLGTEQRFCPIIAALRALGAT